VKRRNWALGAGVAAGGVAGMALVVAALAVNAGSDTTVRTYAPVMRAAPPTPLMTANAAPLMIPAKVRPAKVRPAPVRLTPVRLAPATPTQRPASSGS
jgi:hypothetical protein